MKTNRRTALKAGMLMLGAAAGGDVLARASVPISPRVERRPLRLLLLGGTRYLGPAVVASALARGHDLTLFNRGKTQPWIFPGVPRLKGNRYPEVGEGLSALKKGTWDVVIDLSAQFPRIVQASTDMLAGRVGRYILASSISAYASFSRTGIDENSPLRELKRDYVETPDLVEGDWPTYGARKAQSEAIVRTRFPNHYTILRPGPICGGQNNDGTGAYWAERLFRDAHVLAPGDGAEPTQLIDVHDAADFIVLAAERELPGIYNLVGPDASLTTGKYLEACARAVGSNAEIVWAGDAVPELYNLPLMPPSRLVPGFATISNSRAIAAGLKFRPLEETVRSNWVDHRSRRGNTHDFATAGMGIAAAKEAELLRTLRAKR